MRPPKKIAVVLTALAMAGACGDDPLGPESAALVQYVNATVSPVTGTADAAPASGGVPTNMASVVCSIAPPGSTLGFAQLDTAIATATASTAAGQRYTAVLYGSAANRAAFVLPEVTPTIDFKAPTDTGRYGLRIINATGQTGNIFVTTSTGTATGTPTVSLASATATGGTTGVDGYLITPPPLSRVRFFGTASATTALASITLPTVRAGQLRTVVFTNNATGGVTAFAFTKCELPPSVD